MKYIKKEQWTLDWTKFETIQYAVVRVLFPCLGDALHRSIRRQHFRRAADKLYRAFDVSDWEDITGRTVRLSNDEGSRLGYLDFLDYRKNKSNF